MKIEVKHLNCKKGGKQILQDICAVFEGRKICGIIGPNGSGKTTLLRHIYRQIPSSGNIFVDGTDLSAIHGRECARKIAVMMQHQDLFDSDLKVFEVVQTGRYPYKKILSGYDSRDEEIVEDILQKQCLWEYRNRKLSTLSGGELQRVMICRCLAQQPKTIVLDEPTNHLDIRYKLELMETMKKYDGLVIMSLHDLNLAAVYCDELFVLQEGRMTAHGSPETILRQEFMEEVFNAAVPVYTLNGKVFVGV